MGIHRKPHGQEKTDKAYGCHPNEETLKGVHDTPANSAA
jgi:hypothetical protein